ncbi:PhzF family phenazine biosynthesis protein [Lysinibacillus sphaericus]|uniref:PhzF family phenazine biosynthesis protein n=1 Tax=Lysinibacillus sphaericus TaxID=1421 RepID=A0A544UQ52_LYSSH|nr:PhzF family phenazine biosynthesis protein [Lysinibacillus sp. SDF0037]TQR35965.1 PhzF family phenazine biosynthesis protein [Lysinibacillus sp. SDF0037]
MEKFWLARVFYDEDISGNLTGVVKLESDIGIETSQGIATRLQLPDTAFIWNNKTMQHRTFSPYEELKFCTQTLLASAAVQYGQSIGFARFQYETAVGIVSVFTEGDGFWWIDSNPDLVIPYSDIHGLTQLGISREVLAGKVCIGGVGRRRLYIPLATEDDLYSIRLIPSKVMHICTELGITGISFFVKLRSDYVLLRVFTTSLAGNEDAATGGAALGLIGYDQYCSFGLSSNVRVDQGHIESSSRGCIYLQQDSKSGRTFLGAKVEVLAEGSILPKQMY